MITHPYPRHQLFCKRNHYRHPDNLYGGKSCIQCSKLRNPVKKLEARKDYKNFRYLKTGFNNHLKSKYNITIEDYAWLLYKQNFTCAICPETKDLHLDHNHSTNKVRGILCSIHNHMLGKIECNIEYLPILLEYMKFYA